MNIGCQRKRDKGRIKKPKIEVKVANAIVKRMEYDWADEGVLET